MAAGAVAEQVAAELDEVASEIENVAAATRRLDGRMVGSFVVGVGIGVAVGFYVGYRYSKKKLRVEIYEEAEQEISAMREHYQQKILAVEAQDKPSVSALVEEKGYSTTADPELRIEYARLEDPAETRPTRPPVPVDPPRPRGVPRQIPTPIDPNARVFRTESAMKDKDEDWDYEIEISRRRDDVPYILHQDEYLLNESGYDQVVYVYYSIDDVLVEEEDNTTILNNRENLIGSEALERFGHGSDDYNIVHVRNPELQIEFEINRVPQRWEEEVLGLDPNEPN